LRKCKVHFKTRILLKLAIKPTKVGRNTPLAFYSSLLNDSIANYEKKNSEKDEDREENKRQKVP